MSNDPYQVGDVEYWKDGSATRFDPNSLAFKKRVYGSYSRTSIMSDKDSQKSGIQLKLSPNDVTLSKEDALKEKSRIDSFEGYYGSQFGKSGTWADRNSRQQKAQAYRRLEDIQNRKNIINSILSNPTNISRWGSEERLIQEEKERLIQESEYLRLLNLKDIEDKKLAAIQLQMITFNEQTNSGDFNETPITDVNVNSGCSECTGEKWIDPIIRKGYHTMPDGSLMKDSDMEKKPLNNNMKFVGIAAAGVIGLLLYSKGGLK
jgi:hypothetical protein